MACGAMICFPTLERANLVCGHCINTMCFCTCRESVGTGKDIILTGLPPLPSSPTMVERLARWASISLVHPGISQFDACRFVRDMVDRNMIFTLSLESSRLFRMADDHAAKMEDPAESSRLPALFAAGHIHGNHQEQLASLQSMCESAMRKLVEGSWASMSSLDIALCQNAFQTSDPARYPLGDPGLQLVYDIIGVLTTVHRWAFSTRGWHLRLDGGHLDPRDHGDTFRTSSSQVDQQGGSDVYVPPSSKPIVSNGVGGGGSGSGGTGIGSGGNSAPALNNLPQSSITHGFGSGGNPGGPGPIGSPSQPTQEWDLNGTQQPYRLGNPEEGVHLLDHSVLRSPFQQSST